MVAANALAFAIRDRYPVSRGHTLVITRRVVATWFDATSEERQAVFDLIDEVKRALDRELRPDGYNVGFNAGIAAGQTVMHLHVHVIPRFEGDMDDPRGGVRHVIPSKGNYLRSTRPLATGGDDDPFAHHVLPLFATAREIAIVAAFVQESGLRRIDHPLHGAIARGARIRILTGDYLDITQASALAMLLDWERSEVATESSRDLNGDLGSPAQVTATPRGRFEARVIETEKLRRAFHPKAWRFESDRFGIAFVGSSNLSASALGAGIEWNLRVDRDRDRAAYTRVCEAFEELWSIARVLDSEWVQRYAERAQREPVRLPPGEQEAEPLEPAVTPHEVQLEALDALRRSREEGRRRALVVLATGLGKTWLAAFDYEQLATALGRRPRLLFLAHRQELLRQAARTYRRLMRTRGIGGRVGWFAGDANELHADLVFASVAKLARAEHRAKLAAESFDYVVVDEVHHAAADSYRRILDAVDPAFLLGLTATPDRADALDILGLFDDHIAYSADIGRGIGLGRLVPFHYFGVKDEIDYDNIPWRNRRFDPEALATAVQTEARMQTLWRAWAAHPGTRTLVFCCSVEHASVVKRWLNDRGVRARAVYAAEGSDDREQAIADLENGAIDALCSVDVFNEGVDVPSVDRVVMLRPTESGVIFLQQLGRGLRASDKKRAVTVIDFVGNHRIFLERLRTLLSLGGSHGGRAVRQLLDAESTTELPEGCSVDLELEAKELLSRLFRVSGADEVERVYRELRLERDARPTAGELERMGYQPGRLRARHGSWFEFVRAEGDLTAAEAAAAGVESAGAFLRELETTEMTKSFKMVTLEALLESDGLRAGTDLRQLARHSHAILRRSPELWADVAEDERATSLDDAAAEKRWLAYWRRNPIEAWTSTKKDRRAWFKVEGDRFTPAFSVPEQAQEALASLVRELVDYRLAQYRARQRRGEVSQEGFVCQVLWNKRDPILKLPSKQRASLPQGTVDVRIDGAVWQFRFMKEFCNVAHPAGAQRNQLPDLLRRWFGPSAGQPGTSFDVRFRAAPDGLWAEPLQATVIELGARRGVIAYPDLRAAAGHAVDAAENLEAERAMLPVDSDDPALFAVRVAGTSMDGGRAPLRDGDWALMRLARSAPSSALDGRVILVQTTGEGSGSQYQIKRLKQRDGRWLLTSDNPDGPSFEATQDMTPIARLERAIRPEDLAPLPGTVVGDDDLASSFGLEELVPRSGRHGGHLFVFIDRKGMLTAPDRVRFIPADQRPSEPAYVLARQSDGTFRYLGVGRWTDDGGEWHIPIVDYATWRAWGEGREASRPLPQGAMARAQLAVNGLLQLPESERWIEQGDGRRARILGAAQRGGLRVDGGAGGFGERTVSLTDIAWVVVADDEVQARGGLLDEARVNQLRYLDGTPKGSTRWIDTGWAIAAWGKGKALIREPIASRGGAGVKVRADDGRELDATFRVERVGDRLTVVFESRGGTRGTRDERNTEYVAGLGLILARLGARGLRIDDALVESRDTANLPAAEKRILVDGFTYPIEIKDAARVRSALSAAQAKVGRQPGARGAGNRTRRIRLFVAGDARRLEDLERLLATGDRSSDAERSFQVDEGPRSVDDD